MRTFACGDIHGHLDKLYAALLAAELVDASGVWCVEDTTLVFLGDYVDRGPNPGGVLEYVDGLRTQASQAVNSKVVLLKGNHEQMFLDAAESHENIYLWLMNGGYQAMEAFGFGSKAHYLPQEVKDAVNRYRVILESLEPYVIIDGTMFVHAGVNPKKELKDILKSDDYLWIREPFFQHGSNHFLQAKYGVNRVVFGHTIHKEVTTYFKGSLLAIDTGSFMEKGKISVVELLPDLGYRLAGCSL